MEHVEKKIESILGLYPHFKPPTIFLTSNSSPASNSASIRSDDNFLPHRNARKTLKILKQFSIFHFLKFFGFLPLKSALSEAFKRSKSSITMFLDDLSQYKPSSLIVKDEKKIRSDFSSFFFGHPG